MKVAFATSRVMSVDVHPTDGGNLKAVNSHPAKNCFGAHRSLAKVVAEIDAEIEVAHG